MAIATTTTSWVGQPRIRGSSESTRMFLLTVSSLGLAFCWGTEMTYCNPYLLSLGMPKSKLSLVWVAGPLSGFVMQPIIGVLSDKSTSKYGRRRPFMLGGVAAVVVCFLILGWTREIVETFLGAGGTDGEVERVKSWAVALAVVDIFVLDFVINIAQSTCRALVVDTLPIEKQQLGSAWVSRQGGIGHLLVYAIGALDLNAWLGGFLGDTQFKKVCVIAALGMAVPQCLSCWAVEERVLVRNKSEKGEMEGEGILDVIRHIYHTFRHVPPRIQQICNVQSFSWIGWFPFLFYGSTWVGEIYLRHDAPETMDSNALNDVGRHGSMSMIVWSLISFAASIVLPWFVQSPDDSSQPAYTARPPQSLEGVLSRDVQNVKPTLLTAWAAGNLLFAAAMFFAPMVQSVTFATVLVALCGIPWAIAGWAPITFLGVEVNRMNTSIPIAHSRGGSYHRVSSAGDAIELDCSTESPTTLHIRHDSTASAANSSTGELSGIYLGILNIYTTLPQFVGTGISWIVFSILEPGKSPELAKDAKPGEHHGTEGVSGIGVCLFVGAISSVVAAYACRKLKGG